MNNNIQVVKFHLTIL